MKKQCLVLGVVLALLQSQNAFSYENKGDCEKIDETRFTFSWPITDDCGDEPRGGTSKGADIEFASKPRQTWLDLQKSGLTQFERDRRAILAMQGGYKVNFDFLETVGFSEDYKKDRPYQSWGTEYVYVIEDKPEFISLQHVMVMVFKQEDGSVSEPMVMKHWRQDWAYEDESILSYSHGRQWQTGSIAASERKGTWSQTVFQVDDSPRYASYGKWEHNGSFSTWISAKTRRPLPRREYSVRSDYDLLEGYNRHTVTRTGWVQEEENWKLAVDDNGKPLAKNPYLAKEEGLARYQSIQNFNFKPGNEYLESTAVVWQSVRDYWDTIQSENSMIKLAKEVDGQPMFMPLFELANIFAKGQMSDDEANKQAVAIVHSYLKKP